MLIAFWVQNLKLFQKLCGEESFANVVLVTNKWTEHDKKKAKDEGVREKRLQKTFWHEMIARGSSVARHDGSTESAKRIMTSLISKIPVVLHVVRQVMDENLPWDRTDAGKVINEELEKLRQKTTEEMKELNRLLADQSERNERELKVIMEEKRNAEKQLEAVKEQQMLLETKFVAQSETAEKLKEQLQQEKARMAADNDLRRRSGKTWLSMKMNYSIIMAFVISIVLACWVVEAREVQTIAPTFGLRYLSAFIFFWWKQFFNELQDVTGALVILSYVVWRLYATVKRGGLGIGVVVSLVPLTFTCCMFLFSLLGYLAVSSHQCG